MTLTKAESEEKTTRVIFRGTVQGVGFRQKTFEFARLHPNLNGIVRNLSDGTVELLMQGLDSAQAALSQDLHNFFGNNIDDKETSTIFHAPMTDFRIDY